MSLFAVSLAVTNETACDRVAWPVTRGIPLPAGFLRDTDDLRVSGPDGGVVPLQCRILGLWPDGSIRWVLADFQADAPAQGKNVYTLFRAEPGLSPASSEIDNPSDAIRVEEDEDRIMVDTDLLRFRVGKRRYGLFESVELKRDDSFYPVYQGDGGDACVRISEGSSDGGTQRHLYGMGGVCRASLASDAYRAVVEESGPLRVVIRLDALLEADIPAHHYAGYRPFRCCTRIEAYTGKPFVRLLHTLVMRCNPRETEIEEISFRIPATRGGGLCRYAFHANRDEQGELAPGETLHLAQRSDNHFRVYRYRGVSVRITTEGERSEGWMTLDDGHVGVGVALPYMAEEYPKTLEISALEQGIHIYFWRDPDGKRLSLKRYDEQVAWHEGEGVYADGTGIARTSECVAVFYDAQRRAEAIETLRAVLHPPHTAVDPVWMACCEAAGGMMPADSECFPNSERMMTGFMDWMNRCIRLGRW
ncbi:MAG: hypothetical protein FJY97_10030 [candidate division Zixibacteria bacterium]|nr:hypothetical protein [candidate division Zixibacteria bacterium]